MIYGRKWFNCFTLLVEKLGFARNKSLQINCGYVYENCISKKLLPLTKGIDHIGHNLKIVIFIFFK